MALDKKTGKYFGWIYRAYATEDGVIKNYIGQTIHADWERRKEGHLRGIKRHLRKKTRLSALQEAILRLGEQAFTWQVVEHLEHEDHLTLKIMMADAELEQGLHHKALDGYSRTIGELQPPKTAEHKKSVSDGTIKAMSDPVIRQRISAGVRAALTPEMRKNMSESHKGKPPPNKGKKMSAEFGRKVSAAKKDKPQTKLMGRKRPQEVIDKISASLKGRAPWNKGKSGVQVSWCKGKKMSPEYCTWLAAIRKKNREAKQQMTA